jgi:putative transcriptional regulator
MAVTKTKSHIIDAMTETFAPLKKSGAVSKKQITEFEALKSLERKPIKAKVAHH